MDDSALRDMSEEDMESGILPLLQGNPRLVLPVHAMVCLASFAFALPLAISLFPQTSQISVDKLEPEIAKAADSKIVFYNKGL